MRLLGFGTYDTSRHPRIGVLLDGLADLGAEVVEANVPLGFSTEERVALLTHPWLLHQLVARLLVVWSRLVRQAIRVRRSGPVDGVIVGYMGQFDVLLARVLFPRGTIVLDLLIFGPDTAEDRRVGANLSIRLLHFIDWIAVHSADVVLLDTSEHRELLAPGARQKALVVPVGAPKAWLAAGRDRKPAGSPSDADAPDRPPAATRPLQVVFFGQYTPLQGTVTIGEALAQLAGREDIEVTMIGKGQDRAAAERVAANARVTWLDWVPIAELPGMVASHDVCLGIFGVTAKARRVVPNKVYQGAATACAVVTSDTAPQRAAFDGAAEFVSPGDGNALANLLGELAVDRARVQALGEAAQRRCVERFSPAAVADGLYRLLAEPPPSSRP